MATVDSVNEQLQQVADGVDICWILTCCALVIIMQVGFAYVEAGNVRVKNVRSILLKNAVDYVIGGLCFCFFSTGIQRGESWKGFIGINAFGGAHPKFDTGSEGYYHASTLFTALFACTTSTIISGAIAERMRLSAYMALSTISPIFLFSLPAHWVWNAEGFMCGMNENNDFSPYLNISDFAGGAVVHVTGGIAALTAAWFVGPRIGRYRMSTGTDKDIEGHSVVLAGLGTWLILFGWLGFNAGSSLGLSSTGSAYQAALAALNTFIAVLVGALMSIMYHVLILGKLNLGEMFNNMLAGAAAITAGAGLVPTWASVIIGTLGSVAYILGGPIIAKKLRIDDPLNAISVHMNAAAVGFLLLGLFHEEEGAVMKNGSGKKMAAQVIGLLIICVNSVFWTALVLLVFTFCIGPVRVEERIELLGCDIELDGIAAYEQNDEVHIKFGTVKQNKELLDEFALYLKSIYCYQNILFYEGIEAYEKGVSNPSVDSKTEAQAIYDQFMCPDGTEPVNLPDWQVQQVKRAIDQFTSTDVNTANLTKSGTAKSLSQSQKGMSESALLHGLFTAAKQEVISLLDTTISTHFCHTPVYQKFAKSQSKPRTPAPLHFMTKWWCFRPGKKVKYGRARPFDPRKQFKHTEQLSDESDDDDEGDDFGDYNSNQVAPAAAEDSDDE